MRLETHTGLYLDYDRPRADQVDVADIARALSQTCRFGGHVERFYSVAEHALLVMELVRGAHPDASPAFVSNTTLRAALHHDSHEAYTGDIPTPLKQYMGEGFRCLVARIDLAIGIRIGVSLRSSPAIKAADALALRIEAAHLKTSRGVNEYWGQTGLPVEVMEWRPQFLTAEQAEQQFLAAHRELSR